MPTEKLVEKVGHQISRRRFLSKLGTGVIGALLGLMGLPKIVSAGCSYVTYKCCCLCFSPGGTCQQDCPYSWCWFCNYAPEARDYKCCECIKSGKPCIPDCEEYVSSSFAIPWGTAPAP